MTYDLAIFDLDTALVDTPAVSADVQGQAGGLRQFRCAVELRNLSRRSRGGAACRAASTARGLIEYCVKRRPWDISPAVMPYPDIAMTLGYLRRRGLRLVLVTTQPLDIARAMLGADFLDLFDRIEASAPGRGRIRRYRLTLKALGACADKSLLISQRLTDAVAAGQLGMRFGAPLWACSDAETLLSQCEPDEVFFGVSELRRLIGTGSCEPSRGRRARPASSTSWAWR